MVNFVVIRIKRQIKTFLAVFLYFDAAEFSFSKYLIVKILF